MSASRPQLAVDLCMSLYVCEWVIVRRVLTWRWTRNVLNSIGVGESVSCPYFAVYFRCVLISM